MKPWPGHNTPFGVPTAAQLSPAAVALVRVSGAKADDVLLQMTQRLDLKRDDTEFHGGFDDDDEVNITNMDDTSDQHIRSDQPRNIIHARHQAHIPPPRLMQLCSLYHPETHAILDHHAMVVRFPGPKSFTGEDVVEFHIHGGPAVVASVMDALMSCGPGIRPATPGEFTKRAFLRGKMDLTQVEGLSDLLHAETEVQRKLAVAAASGIGKEMCQQWRHQCIRCMAAVEAVIDFGEDDIGPTETARVLHDCEHIVRDIWYEIEKQLHVIPRGEIVQQGFRVVLVGPPNVGKSSLLNALTRRNAAIVSPISGTTRDIIESAVEIRCHKVILTDGAGIHDGSNDAIEQEGIQRIMDAARAAHILVRVTDIYYDDMDEEIAGRPFDRIVGGNGRVDDKQQVEGRSLDTTIGDDRNNETCHRIQEGTTSEPYATPIIHVVNKIDLIKDRNSCTQQTHTPRRLYISCMTGDGIDEMVLRLADLMDSMIQQTDTLTAPASFLFHRSRHQHHMRQCIQALERFLQFKDSLELAAEELRTACTELGHITGAIETNDILDSIFTEFCIGK